MRWEHHLPHRSCGELMWQVRVAVSGGVTFTSAACQLSVWGSAVSLGPLPSWAPASALPEWVGMSGLGGCGAVGRQGKVPSSKTLRGVSPTPQTLPGRPGSCLLHCSARAVEVASLCGAEGICVGLSRGRHLCPP